MVDICRKFQRTFGQPGRGHPEVFYLRQEIYNFFVSDKLRRLSAAVNTEMKTKKCQRLIRKKKEVFV